jgi:small nuclear ribonucleoprotein (snRNP)-like protein
VDCTAHFNATTAKIFLLSHVARVVVLRPSDLSTLQIFLSFFKTLVGKEIAVELKNDVVLTGTLHSVDQYLNVKLMNVKIINPEKYPQLTALHNCFVRGSVVRYIQIPPEYVDTELLQDAARKENAPASATK